MVKFLLWLLLLVFCWPLALAAVVLYPIVWLVSLPFRILGIAVEGVFSLLTAIVTLPARVLGWKRKEDSPVRRGSRRSVRRRPRPGDASESFVPARHS